MRNPNRRAATVLVQICDVAGSVAPDDDKHVDGHERQLPGGRSLPFGTLNSAPVEFGDHGSIGLEFCNHRMNEVPAEAFAERELASLRGRIGNGAAPSIIWSVVLPLEAFDLAAPPYPSSGRQS